MLPGPFQLQGLRPLRVEAFSKEFFGRGGLNGHQPRFVLRDGENDLQRRSRIAQRFHRTTKKSFSASLAAALLKDHFAHPVVRWLCYAGGPRRRGSPFSAMNSLRFMKAKPSKNFFRLLPEKLAWISLQKDVDAVYHSISRKLRRSVCGDDFVRGLSGARRDARRPSCHSVDGGRGLCQGPRRRTEWSDGGQWES